MTLLMPGLLYTRRPHQPMASWTDLYDVAAATQTDFFPNCVTATLNLSLPSADHSSGMRVWQPFRSS